jgi:hypothetical protein
MADPVKFEFSRPATPRVIDVEYVSPPVCIVCYYVPGTGGGATGLLEL